MNSTHEVAPLYTALDAADQDPTTVGVPGEYPVHARHPSRRAIAASSGRCASSPASAAATETNARYKFLLAHGQTGLSVAFDFPTLMGYDSDHPRSEGEVGKCGVAISSLADMETLFDGHSARQGLDVDDDQRAGDHPLGVLHRRGREAGRRHRRSCAGRFRTTSSRSTWRSTRGAFPSSPRCA